MISFRIDTELEQQLNKYSEQQQKNKSQVIKEALVHYFSLQEQEDKPTPYQIGEPLFGRYSSGENDLSTTYKQRLKEKIRGKNSH